MILQFIISSFKFYSFYHLFLCEPAYLQKRAESITTIHKQGKKSGFSIICVF